MTDQPYDAADEAEAQGHRMIGADTEIGEDSEDVEGHGRFGQFLDSDAAETDPYPLRPPGASER